MVTAFDCACMHFIKVFTNGKKAVSTGNIMDFEKNIVVLDEIGKNICGLFFATGAT